MIGYMQSLQQCLHQLCRDRQIDNRILQVEFEFERPAEQLQNLLVGRRACKNRSQAGAAPQ